MTADGMSVLIVAPTLPYPPHWGFATRVYQLSKNLAVRNHVALLCHDSIGTEKYVERLREVIDEVHVVPLSLDRPAKRRARQLLSVASRESFHVRGMVSPGMQGALDRLLDRRQFDIVQLESSRLCGLSLPTELSLVIDEHNIESELLRRMSGGERSPARRLFNALECAKYTRFENRVWSCARACVVTSDRDAHTVRRRVPRLPTEVVPNGVDLEFFAPGGAQVDPNSIVFTGLLTYRPNLEAARMLAHDILPRIRRARPDTVLTLVGYGGEPELAGLRGPGIVVTGWVPDVRPYVRGAAAVVVPLRIGSGTRLKVLEALSMAKPVVSTPLGCEGIDVRDGDHLLIGESSDEIASLVVRVLSEPATAGQLGRAGRDLVARQYSWKQAGRTLEEWYARVLDTGRARPPKMARSASSAGRAAVGDPSDQIDAQRAGSSLRSPLDDEHPWGDISDDGRCIAGES
jgi:glycosyltransferase involved in cell wall biosynthesis